jgi:RNase H-fold protein (predicted Holliday junction resolvase)
MNWLSSLRRSVGLDVEYRDDTDERVKEATKPIEAALEKQDNAVISLLKETLKSVEARPTPVDLGRQPRNERDRH